MNEEQRTERIAKQSVRTVRMSSPTHAPENYYFPININQIRELEESLHTRLEMLNLTKKAEDAAKIVFNEYLWRWFSDAQENSNTSYKGCIAPVVMSQLASSDTTQPPSNRWGWDSLEHYTRNIED